MTDQQIHRLSSSPFFIKKYGAAKLVKTHISWVILAQDFVFKIKKPLYYSFLDFSTLEKRKFYCERELELNRRLTKDMYLAVVPIFKKDGQIFIENGSGEIIDHAVKMKRMDESRQMNLLLEQGKVTPKHMDALANILAPFHKNAKSIKTKVNIEKTKEDFADILRVEVFVREEIGEEAAKTIKEAVSLSNMFLNTHSKRILERQQKGFTIDGHGDLYSQNIFLPEGGEPIIFDCIEFSDHLRQVDVLSELAFFCMDLDYYKKPELAEYFLKKYNLKNPCLPDQEDTSLFNYYKMYRANVRAKVGAFKAEQMRDKEAFEKQIKFVGDYILLMKKYMGDIYLTNTRN